MTYTIISIISHNLLSYICHIIWIRVSGAFIYLDILYITGCTDISTVVINSILKIQIYTLLIICTHLKRIRLDVFSKCARDCSTAQTGRRARQQFSGTPIGVEGEGFETLPLSKQSSRARRAGMSAGGGGGSPNSKMRFDVMLEAIGLHWI